MRARWDMIELYEHITVIYQVQAEYIMLENKFTRGHDKINKAEGEQENQ